MSLGRFIEPIPWRALAAHLAAVAQLLGGVLLVPSLVALAHAEWVQSGWFAVPAALGLLLGTWGRTPGGDELSTGDAIALTAASYLLFAVVGAVPFLPYLGPVDALFEAMSGFTTTGLSVARLDRLPASLVFFRAWAQWVGGAGIVALSLAVLVAPGTTTRRLYASSEIGGQGLVVNVLAAARQILGAYVALTVVAAGALWLAGLAPWEALLYALATTSTGGFAPHADSIGHYAALPWVAPVATGLMLLGAVSMPLYAALPRRGPGPLLRDLQARWFLGLVALAVPVLWFTWGDPGQAAFRAATAASTSGFSLEPVATRGDRSDLVTVLLMAIGGSSGSTAGGLKVLRLVLLARIAQRALYRMLLPTEARVPLTWRGMTVSDREQGELVAFVAAFVVLLVVGAVGLTFAGAPPLDALFESTSAIGTVGLSSGVTSPDLAAWARLLLIFEMWVGRLEVLPVLLLLYRLGRIPREGTS